MLTALNVQVRPVSLFDCILVSSSVLHQEQSENLRGQTDLGKRHTARGDKRFLTCLVSVSS